MKEGGITILPTVTEAVAMRCSIKKVFLKMLENSQGNTCVGVSFLPQAWNFMKKETPTHVFSCEFCEIFKNTFFSGTLPVAASAVTYYFFYRPVNHIGII